MPEASDTDSIDNVSSFLAVLADSFCGLTKIWETTSVFTKYVDMVNFLFKASHVF